MSYTEDELNESFLFYKDFVKQYVFISSAGVYDTSLNPNIPKTEEDPKPLDIWPYSVNKWNAEQSLMRLSEGSGINYTIIRPSVTYGFSRIPYGMSPRYGYHWTIASRILNSKPIITWNQGRNRVNMMRVEDFASALVPLFGNYKAYNQAFNICGDEAPTFMDVLNIMSVYLDKDIITIDIDSEFYAEQIPHRAGEILGGRSIDALSSNSKIKKVIPQWKQTIFLKEGVQRTLDAYKEQNFQKGIDWAFDGECDRIISRWCKKQGTKTGSLNLGFKDYLGTATLTDKLRYYKEYWRDNSLVKNLVKLRNLAR